MWQTSAMLNIEKQFKHFLEIQNDAVVKCGNTCIEAKNY